MSAPIETVIHLHPATPQEREVRVRALVSLSHGHYRIDRLEVLDFGHVAAHELEQVYDHVVETARAYHRLPDDSRT